jgi:hypothetical protein
MKKFIGGMAKDTSKAEQPDGTYRDALNATVSVETGTMSNEWGNELAVSLNVDVVGAIPIDEERLIIFGIGVNQNTSCEIILVDPVKKETTVLYRSDKLNFKRSHPIIGEYRRDAKNDVIVYFTDNYYVIDETITEASYVSDFNPPRTFNVTRQLQWFAIAPGASAFEVLYGENNYTVDKLSLFPEVGTHSRIKNAYVFEGGAVRSGTYHLALAYADEDFVETNYFVVSNPVYIIPEPDTTVPADIVIGAQGGTTTTKSVHWEVYIPKTVQYKYLQPAVIQRIGNAENVYKLDRIQIQSTNDDDAYDSINTLDIVGNTTPPTGAFNDPSIDTEDFVADRRTSPPPAPFVETSGQASEQRSSSNFGLSSSIFTIVYSGREDASTLSLLDIVADQVKYLTAKTLTQLNDRLYLGNLISRKDIGFQRYASNIKIKPVVKAVEGFDRRVYDIITLNKGYGTMVMPYYAVKEHPAGFDGIGQTYYQSEQNGAPANPATLGIDAVDSMYPDYVSSIADYLRYPDSGQIQLRLGDGKFGVSYNLAQATRRGYKDNRFSYRGKSFRRGDVYAFYVSFVLRDGTETFAYHIPGRREVPLVTTQQQANIISNSGLCNGDPVPTDTYYKFLLGELDPNETDCLGDYLMESDRFTHKGENLHLKSHGFHAPELKEQSKVARIYQVIDTSYNTSFAGGDPINHGDDGAYTALKMNMGFWENQSERYPENFDWVHADVDRDTGEQTNIIGPGNTDGYSFDSYYHKYYSLYGRKVRHHRMPSNYNPDFSYVKYSGAGEDILTGNNTGIQYGPLAWDRNYGGIFFENAGNLSQRGFVAAFEDPTTGIPQTYQNNLDYLGAAWISNHRDKKIASDSYVKKKLITSETVRILGIQLENLKIPKHMLKEIQGYKIYYAKRTNSDRLISGQSLAIPAMPRYASSPNQNRLLARKGPYFNAFYAFGGLRSDMETAMAVASKWKAAYHTDNNPDAAGRGQEQVPNPNRAEQFPYAGPTIVDRMFRYYANPVFTFHDFNMLRKRPTLNTVTHIQCQAAIAFRQFQGGPGVFGARKEDEENKEKLTTFPSLGWISQALGNTVDYNVDGEIYDVTDTFIDADEDVSNPYGSDNPPADQEDKPGGLFKRAFRRLRGKEKDVDDIEDYSDVSELRARRYRIRSYRGGAYVACAHYHPEQIYRHREIIKGGDHRWNGQQNIWYNSAGKDWSLIKPAGFEFVDSYCAPRNSQFTFMLDPGSKTYLPGQRNLKTAESSSFKGAQYIFNRGGESSIVMALVSGLPHLKGLVPFKGNAIPGFPWYLGDGSDDGGGEYGPFNIAAWGDDDKFLFPDAWFQASKDPKPVRPIPDHAVYLYGSSVTTENSNFKGLNYTLAGADYEWGYPMAWLINVCSLKTDVYTPFDKQELVWTGYYYSIDEEFKEWEDKYNLAEGACYAALKTGTTAAINDLDFTSAGGSTVLSPVKKYFSGAESTEVYGGDTYISKYAFRTTSHSYGHSWFRASSALGDAGPSGASGLNSTDALKVIGNPGTNGVNLGYIQNTRQKDVPDFLSLNDFLTNWGTAGGMSVWQGNFITTITDTTYPEFPNSTEVGKIESFISETLLNANNWQQGNSNPVTSLFTFMVESDDNIGLRHQKDSEKGQATKFFDFNTAAEVLFSPPTQDFTKQDQLLYEDHFSFVQDKRVAVPFPKVRAGTEENDQFRNRIIRSKSATGALSDRYREFLANDYADIPKKRGDITDMFTMNDTLYVHTEKALFQTKGNEQLELGSVKAFIGSGDIFAIPPTELQESEIGYGGTMSGLSSYTTEVGHFYVSRRSRKVHMLTQGITEVMGNMNHWFRENIPFEIERYGINVDAHEFPYYPDAPTNTNVPMGFIVGYDPKFKRIILTKREPLPTQTLIDGLQDGTIEIQNNMFFAVQQNNSKTGVKLSKSEREYTHRRNLEAFRENTAIDKLGPSDTAREIASDINHPANKGNVKSGPIGLSNPTYFTQSGWTLSYLPDLQIWISRHSYVPDIFITGEQTYYTMYKGSVYMHNDEDNPGNFYNTLYNFELEFIDNANPAMAKLYSNVYYWADAKSRSEDYTTEFKRQTFPIFDRFYVYNTTQISGEFTEINYLNNCRLVDGIWYINSFRDLAAVVVNTNSYINTGEPNVVGKLTTKVESTREDTPMFTYEGVPNPEYINAEKQWYEQKKFIGHYLGVRLISNNESKNLIYLYSAGTKFRNSYR